jgi:TolB-like protein
LLVLSLILILGLEGNGINAQRKTSRNRRARTTSNDKNNTPPRDNSVLLSLAILPFHPSSSDPETAALGSGIADSLSNALKSIAGFTVTDMEVVSEAANRFSQNLNKDDDALEMGRQLGVSILVTGSYQRFGNQIRIDVRLLSVDLNRPLPGEAIEVTAPYPDGYSTLLNQLAVEVTGALRVNMRPDEANRVREALTPANSMQAQKLYNQGIANMRVGSYAAITRAIELFGNVLQIDPGYALAYAAKAEAEVRLYDLKQSAGEDATATGQEALRDATSAVNKSPNMGQGYRALAKAQRRLGNYTGAASSARRAIERWPNDAGSYLELGRAGDRGRLNRSAALGRAFQLQPGLALILKELPKVLIINNSSYDLKVQFVPTGGERYPTVQVPPASMRIVPLLPGSYQVIAQTYLGEIVMPYTFEAGIDYKLPFEIQELEHKLATLIFKNTESFTVRVQVSGPQSFDFVVTGGESKNFLIPPGTYLVRTFPGARNVSSTYSDYTLEAGLKLTIEYYVRRQLR